MRGGGIKTILKKLMNMNTMRNVVDKDGKQLKLKAPYGYEVEPKVNELELHNVKKYLENKSRFILGIRYAARPGLLQTDFLEITYLNFYNKLDDNNYELLKNGINKTQIPPMTMNINNINTENKQQKEEIEQEFRQEEKDNLNRFVESTNDSRRTGYNDLRDEILDFGDEMKISNPDIIEKIKKNYESIYNPRKFDNLYFSKDIYQPID